MVPDKSRSIFFVLLLISIILRFYSFFPAVIDHDESTYLIIGRDIIHGKLLYTDVTDTKPVGIFLIYAFFNLVFGNSIFLTRVFVAIMVGITAFLVFRSSLKIFSERSTAFAAGVIYILYTSTWSWFGVGPNTELFFNLTTIGGFILLLEKRTWSFFLAGFIFGVGFIIKYMVLLDFIFLAGFFLFVDLISNKWKIGKINVMKYLLSGIGFSLPFILVNLYFYLGDHFEDFRYITYVLPGKYGQGPHLENFLIMMVDFFARFIPVSAMFFYVMFSKTGFLRKEAKFMFLFWIFGILIAIYLPGKNFGHYTIQLMLPFSIIAGLILHPEFRRHKFFDLVFNKTVGLPLLILTVLTIQAFAIYGKLNSKDKPREVASYLKAKMKPGETLYTSDYEQILYYLLGKDSPTKYVHPTLLSVPENAMAMGVDGYTETEKIIVSQPDYVVVSPENQTVMDLIKPNYTLDTLFFTGKVAIYRKNKLPGGFSEN